jgi:hypothetical protein
MRDGKDPKLMRPRTAATSNNFDEARIKNKIDYLDKIEREIDVDIEKIMATPTV